MIESTEWKRVKIAEACGWSDISDWKAAGINGKYPTGPWTEVIPDYFQCLNAMHEAEKVLTVTQWPNYVTRLCSVTRDRNGEGLVFASATQRAEAFGLTLGLWKPGQTEEVSHE